MNGCIKATPKPQFDASVRKITVFCGRATLVLACEAKIFCIVKNLFLEPHPSEPNLAVLFRSNRLKVPKLRKMAAHGLDSKLPIPKMTSFPSLELVFVNCEFSSSSHS